MKRHSRAPSVGFATRLSSSTAPVSWRRGGRPRRGRSGNLSTAAQAVAWLLAACRRTLGTPSFRAEHGVRFPCMSGAMANGIGSVEIVEAMGRAGMLGIFGSAGLPLAKVEATAVGTVFSGVRSASATGLTASTSSTAPMKPAIEAGSRFALPEAAGSTGRGLGVSRPDAADRSLPGLGPASRRLGPGLGSEPGDRQGLADRGGLEISLAAASEIPQTAWSTPARSLRPRPIGPAGSRWPTT